MKNFPLLVLLCFSTIVMAQQKRISDEDIELAKDKNGYELRQISTGKILADNLLVDEIVFQPFHGMLGVRKGDKCGIINYTGKLIYPYQFTPVDPEDGNSAFEFLDDYLIVHKDSLMGVINAFGVYEIPLGKYTSISYAGQDVLLAFQNDACTVFRKGKRLFQQPVYLGEAGLDFYDERACGVLVNNEKEALVSFDGKWITPYDYDRIRPFYKEYWLLEKDSICELRNNNGSLLCSVTATFIDEMKGNYFTASKNGMFGLFDRSGKQYLNFDYDDVLLPVVNNKVWVWKYERWGLLDLSEPDSVNYYYSETPRPEWNKYGLALLTKNLKQGVIDTTGKIILPFEYETQYAANLSDYLAYIPLMKDQKHGLFATSGTFILPCEYDHIVIQNYQPTLVQRNGKIGYLNDRFKVLIPIRYDSIQLNLFQHSHLVYSGGKAGVYDETLGDIIAPQFDSVYTQNENYVVVKNKLLGIYKADGTPIVEPQLEVIHEVVENDYLIGLKNNRLVQMNLTSGTEMTLSPDSTCVFGNVSFLNFGGQFTGDSVRVNGKQRALFGGGRWYVVNNANQQLIGQPYYTLGVFNEQGQVVATPINKDLPIAINTKGEELRPRFHLESKVLYSRIIYDASIDTLLLHLQNAKLLPEKTDITSLDDLNKVFHIELTPADYVNEYGEFITIYDFQVYDQKSAFSVDKTFPEVPNYVFSTFDYYARLGEPNEQGWYWAVPRAYARYNEQEQLSGYEHAVLINDQGEEKRVSELPNYGPKFSKPLFEFTSPMRYDSTNTSMLLEQLEQFKRYFSLPNDWSNDQLAKAIADSIYLESLQMEYYDEMSEGAWGMNYLYTVYRKNNLQLFHLPPPAHPIAQFCPDRFEAVAATKGLKTPQFMVQETVGDENIVVFGDHRYFIYPSLPENLSLVQEQKAAAIMSRNYSEPALKHYFTQFPHYQQLVHTGVARLAVEAPDSMYALRDLDYNRLKVYEYDVNVGVLAQNKVVLPPVYCSIALRYEKGSPVSILALDSVGKLTEWSPKQAKVSVLKQQRGKVNTGMILITMDEETKALFAYPVVNTKPVLPLTERARVLNVGPIQAFFNLTYSDIPIANSLGEDSIRIGNDGTVSFVYAPADTMAYTAYHNLHVVGDLNYWLTTSNEVYYMGWMQEPSTRLSDRSVQQRIPINEFPEQNLCLLPSGKKMVVRNEKGQEMVFSMKQYLLLSEIAIGENGYGGWHVKNQFFTYQNGLPFPEQHAVYMHVGPKAWLVGINGKLELVSLAADNTIAKRYHQPFTSYDDFFDYFIDFAYDNGALYEFVTEK